jgi:hypothetical protein
VLGRQPLVEDCDAEYLAEFQQLTALCDSASTSFLKKAPSRLTISSMDCFPAANGEYQLQGDTIGAKPHWILCLDHLGRPGALSVSHSKLIL